MKLHRSQASRVQTGSGLVSPCFTGILAKLLWWLVGGDPNEPCGTATQMFFSAPISYVTQCMRVSFLAGSIKVYTIVYQKNGWPAFHAPNASKRHFPVRGNSSKSKPSIQLAAQKVFELQKLDKSRSETKKDWFVVSLCFSCIPYIPCNSEAINWGSSRDRKQGRVAHLDLRSTPERLHI